MNIFQKYISYGLSVIPCGQDKRPLLSWKEYQSRLAGEECARWSGNIAIVCGAVSGGVVCVDFDIKNGDHYSPFCKIINDNYPEILSRLVFESSPSGGVHVVFRTETEVKNVKLAKMKGGKEATIETRGEGGYFLCAPSTGYELTFGDFSKLSLLTEIETDLILSACKSLSEGIEDKSEPEERIAGFSGLSPFDDYNKRHDIVSLLEKHGWGVVFNRGEATYFCRPGKESGISASWNSVPERFYVFSTSTEFENAHIYKASAVYAILEHGGDFGLAAKALYAEGFGDRVTVQRQEVVEHNIAGTPLEESSGKKCSVCRPMDFWDDTSDLYQNGRERGYDLEWPSMRPLMQIVRGLIYVFTGMPGHGKTEFVLNIAMHLSMSNGARWAIFSPENYPAKEMNANLVEKVLKQQFFGADRIEFEVMKKALVSVLDKHVVYLGVTDDSVTLDQILNTAKELDIDGLIIDPYNELESTRPTTMSSTEFVGYNLMRLRRFAKLNNKMVFVTAHPVKVKKDEDGKVPVVELYDIADSAHWRNKADFGVSVYRNKETGMTDVYVQKVRFRHHGKIGCASLSFDTFSGSFREPNRDIPADFGWQSD